MLKNLKNRIMLLGMSAMNTLNLVHASVVPDPDPGSLMPTDHQTGADLDLSKILAILLDVMSYVSAAGIIVAVIMLIWCGIQMASSAGNPQKRAMAMEGIKSTLVAAAIIGAASTIANVAVNILK